MGYLNSDSSVEFTEASFKSHFYEKLLEKIQCCFSTVGFNGLNLTKFMKLVGNNLSFGWRSKTSNELEQRSKFFEVPRSKKLHLELKHSSQSQLFTTRGDRCPAWPFRLSPLHPRRHHLRAKIRLAPCLLPIDLASCFPNSSPKSNCSSERDLV